MKALKIATFALLILAIVEWILLLPRYAHPDNSTLSLIIAGIAPIGLLLIGLITASVFALLPTKKYNYKTKLETLT